MSKPHHDLRVLFPEANFPENLSAPMLKTRSSDTPLSPLLPSGASDKWKRVQNVLGESDTIGRQKHPTIEVLDSVSDLSVYSERAQVLEELRPVLRLLISKLTNFRFKCNQKWITPYAKTYIYGGENFFAWWEEQNNFLPAELKEERPPFRRPLDIDVWVPVHVDSWEEANKMQHKEELFLRDLANIWNSEEVRVMWTNALERLEAEGRLVSDVTLTQKQSSMHYFNPAEKEHPTWANDKCGIYFLYKDTSIVPDHVRTAFKAFGQIQRVYFRRNHRANSAGYACVFFKREEDFKKAIEKGSTMVGPELVHFEAKTSSPKNRVNRTLDNARMYRTITMEYYEDYDARPIPLVEFQLRPRCAWGQHFKRASTLTLKPPHYTVGQLVKRDSQDPQPLLKPTHPLHGAPTIRVLSVKDTYKACSRSLENRTDKRVKSRTDIQRIMWFCKQFDNIGNDIGCKMEIPKIARASSIYDRVQDRLSRTNSRSPVSKPVDSADEVKPPEEKSQAKDEGSVEKSKVTITINGESEEKPEQENQAAATNCKPAVWCKPAVVIGSEKDYGVIGSSGKELDVKSASLTAKPTQAGGMIIRNDTSDTGSERSLSWREINDIEGEHTVFATYT